MSPVYPGIVMMKSTKPPPPVPPRPSKSVVMEALAKTRQAHQGKFSSATIESQENETKTGSNLGKPTATIECYGTRPVIYQSDNCKKRISNETVSISRKTTELKLDIPSGEKDIPTKRAPTTTVNHNLVNCSESVTKPSSTDDVSSVTSNSSSSTSGGSHKNDHCMDKNWDEALNDRNHVNTLIDEMFASVLEVNLSSSSTESIIKEVDNKITITNTTPEPKDDDNLTVIVINDEREKKVKFDDQQNHEYLIKELQNMKIDKVVSRRQRTPSVDSDEQITPPLNQIQTNAWYDDGKKLSNCQIQVENTSSDSDMSEKIKNITKAYRLPPLPKSLSAFKFMDSTETIESNDSSSTKSDDFGSFKESPILGREETRVDKQLALLRQEMTTLRQQDLTLLSKLLFLSESIHDFRQMMQDQEEEKNGRLTPSPTPSSIDDEDDDYYVISTSTC